MFSQHLIVGQRINKGLLPAHKGIFWIGNFLQPGLHSVLIVLIRCSNFYDKTAFYSLDVDKLVTYYQKRRCNVSDTRWCLVTSKVLITQFICLVFELQVSKIKLTLSASLRVFLLTRSIQLLERNWNVVSQTLLQEKTVMRGYWLDLHAQVPGNEGFSGLLSLCDRSCFSLSQCS